MYDIIDRNLRDNMLTEIFFGQEDMFMYNNEKSIYTVT